MTWDEGDLRIINGLQSDLPVVAQPFAAAGRRLAMTEAEVLSRLERLLADGVFSRFAPLVNAERLGGGVTLAAMRLPPSELARVADQVNNFPQVSQNYARDHVFNLWFVVATEHPQEVATTLQAIAQTTGYRVYPMPKQTEYRVGFRLALTAEGGVTTVPWEDATPLPMVCDPVDRQLVAALQAGLPILSQPYHVVADQVGLTVETVLTRVAHLLASGVFRRIGGVPNHYRLGLRANGMSVWSVPESRIDLLGRQVAALDFVTHCYHRPSPHPDWPYNLFAMVHGQQRSEVVDKAAVIAQLLGEDHLAGEILFSTAVLKKTGLRLKPCSASKHQG